MKNFKILPLVSVVLLTAHLALAQTWTQTSAPITNWTAIACSADGGRLIAAANGGVGPGYTILPGPIYISTNSGTTWTQATNVPAATWCSVASSADGTKLLAAVSRGGIYRSVDSGLTWTQTSAPSNNWVSVTSSADGNKLAALARIFPRTIFILRVMPEYPWITNALPYDRWLAMASSADGNTLAACGPGTVLVSTNSGGSWTTNLFNASAVASSADGSRLLVAGSSGIYLSINSGLTWTQIKAPAAGHIASSASGSKLVATGWVGYNTTIPVYVSTNFGATWATNVSPSANWTFVVSSADGNQFAAVVNGGGIWTLQTMPAPQLNLTPASGNLKLSWIMPTTNFVMQQSADLGGWKDMTNVPVLNLTNLQNEVTLLPSNSRGFYRLKTP